MQKKNYLILSIVSLIAFLLILSSFNYWHIDNSINAFFAGNPNSALMFISSILAVIFDIKCMAGIILICSLVLWLYNKRKDSIFLVYLAIADGILIYLLKQIIQRARPENLIESSFSFPSGHASIAIVFLGFFAYFFAGRIINKPAKISFIAIITALILSVSLSRLILRVHWFTDVLAGIFLGLFILLGGIWVRKLR